MDQWLLKTFALFHDPPHKPLVLGRGHEEVGYAIASGVCGGRTLSEAEREAIRRADHIASGADRAQFLRDLKVDPLKELTLIHPMDAATLARETDDGLEFAEVRLTGSEIDNARSLVEGPEFQGAFGGVSDPRLRYFLLWRFTTDLLRALEGQGGERLGALWDVLPADTRLPNHPVAVHNSLVASLAPIFAAGKEPALLRFAIGPVQPFIEAARSLADLWAGSYLLARGIFEAIAWVVEHHGPDAILFPHLRWQPLFDAWLAKQCEGLGLPDPLKQVVEAAKKRAEDQGLRIPSLPNLFVAVVPNGETECLVNKCEERVRGFFRELAQTRIAEAWPGPVDETVLNRAEQQWNDLIEVHWSLIPWPQVGDIQAWLSQDDAWPLDAVNAARELLTKIEALPGYRPNSGALYPVVSEQGAILMDAAKRDRLGGGSPREEGGLKCSMCGEREVLGGRDFYEQRDLWRTMADNRSEYSFTKEKDALCGVCLVKRLVGRKGPEGTRAWRHPSTSEVATSRLKIEVLQRCEEDDALRSAIEALERAKQRLDDPDRFRVFALPAVYGAAGDDGIWKEFAQTDGAILIPSRRRDPEEEKDFKKIQVEQDELLRHLKNKRLPRPSPYLAVVVFDGDEIGKWLSGEKAPSLWEMLHPKARGQIANGEAVLRGIRRPVTPAIHAAISQICASFAQHAVPWTIEREGLPGHLVYAGGDDALFLAPPLDALRLVWRLRWRFAGHPGGMRPDEDPPWPGDPSSQPDAQNGSRPWFIAREVTRRRVLLAFGCRATASAGMCVFHHKDPLGLALERAREAEQRAKREGRDRLGVTVMRRSGQESQTVLPFDDTMLRVLELTRWFADHEVSRSLHVLMEAEIARLHPDAGGNASQLFEMASSLVHRVIDRRLVEDEPARAILRDLVMNVGERFSPALSGMSGHESLRKWTEAVSIAEFLARPYDRREEE